MRIGLTELLVIAVVAIALIKPEKMRDIAGNIGKAMRIIKEENAKLNKEVVDPIKEAVEPVKEMTQPVTEMKNEIDNTVNNIKDNTKISLKKDEDK